MHSLGLLVNGEGAALVSGLEKLASEEVTKS